MERQGFRRLPRRRPARRPSQGRLPEESGQRRLDHRDVHRRREEDNQHPLDEPPPSSRQATEIIPAAPIEAPYETVRRQIGIFRAAVTVRHDKHGSPGCLADRSHELDCVSRFPDVQTAGSTRVRSTSQGTESQTALRPPPDGGPVLARSILPRVSPMDQPGRESDHSRPWNSSEIFSERANAMRSMLIKLTFRVPRSMSLR
jgi:hypothetical protein